MKTTLALGLLLASLATPCLAFQRETTNDPDCTEDIGVNCPHDGVPLVWKSFPVTYVINATNSGLSSSDAVAAIDASFQTWQSASNGKVTFVSGGDVGFGGANGQDHRNTVVWTNLGSSASDTFAQSILTYSTSTGEIADVDIQLNSANAWAILPSGQDDPFDFRVDVQAVVTHEVGHLLGLAHENRFGSQVVMFFSDTTGNTTHRTLTSDDRDGLLAIYGSGSTGGGSSGGGGGGGCSLAGRSSPEEALPVLLLLGALLLRERKRRAGR